MWLIVTADVVVLLAGRLRDFSPSFQLLGYQKLAILGDA